MRASAAEEEASGRPRALGWGVRYFSVGWDFGQGNGLLFCVRSRVCQSLEILCGSWFSAVISERRRKAATMGAGPGEVGGIHAPLHPSLLEQGSFSSCQLPWASSVPPPPPKIL